MPRSPSLGIDLDGTKIGTGLIDHDRTVRYSDAQPTLSTAVRVFPSASAQATAVLAGIDCELGIVGAAGAAWVAAQRR